VDALAASAPRFAGWGLAVAQALVEGPLEVAVLGRPGEDGTTVLHRTALAGTSPGLVVAFGPPAGAGTDDQPDVVPLLRDRPLVGDRPTAYVCRGFVCELPSTAPDDLGRRVGGRVPVPAEHA
ncbi:MAG: hypothetical protein ACLGIA_13390, partial [Actinomycetes bacterium]